MVSASCRRHSTGAGQVASTARCVRTIVVAITAISLETSSGTVAPRLEEGAAPIGVRWVAVVDNVHCVVFVKLVTAKKWRAHILGPGKWEISVEGREGARLV